MLNFVLATTLETCWKNCVTFELKQHRYLMTGVSAVFLTGFSFDLHTHASNRFWFCFQPFFSSVGNLPQCLVVPYAYPWKAQLRVFLPLRVLMNICAHNMWNPLMELILHDAD